MKIDALKRITEHEVEAGLQKIKRDAEYLIGSMEKLIERIEKEGTDVILDSFGELQFQGVGLDIQVAAFCAKQKSLAGLNTLDTEDD